ncbi:MAG: four helix bundle protein [Planctomycetota bacterium]|nr:four helix bundle protein [Planctomycetota bacterium]
MGRLREELLERVESFSHRVADIADALEGMGKSRRVVDQLYGSGTSVGANTFETTEAMSRADFCRGVSVILKELAEVRYWVRFVGRRGWIATDRLTDVEQEAHELRLIFGAILARTRREATNR